MKCPQAWVAESSVTQAILVSALIFKYASRVRGNRAKGSSTEGSLANATIAEAFASAHQATDAVPAG
ncbi:hypothetical protein MTO96_013845 [Rhipicephalus appendiculatus]